MSWQSEHDRQTAHLELQRIRAEAEEITCEYCHAEPGQPCRNTATKEPLDKLPAHRVRMKEVSV